jgi:parallel beta-helix repeat protein
LRLLSDGNNIDLIQVFIEKDFVKGNVTGGINILNMKLKNSIANSMITDNSGPGIELDGISDVRIDGDTISGNHEGILINGAATGSISNNLITGNSKGIALAGTGTGIAINGNSIFNNTGLGIDLGNDGVTPNHMGFISGPNNFQNYPVLTAAGPGGGNTIIKGTLNSLANDTFRLEFFSNGACNTSGFGEGQTFLGFKRVITDATGNVAFSDTLAGVNVPVGSAITSTATDSAGNSSEFSACVLATVLPLHLLDFTASTNGNHIRLDWVTAGEENTKYFAIERSEDGKTFTEEGQVQASGNSSEQKNYVFIDRQPLQGINIYRLRMVDMDGHFTYSKIVAVTMDAAQTTLSLFPNPAARELTVHIFATGLLQLKLVDLNGRILKEEVRQLSGNTSTILDISNLSEGVYILILQNSNEIQYRKFIKQ